VPLLFQFLSFGCELCGELADGFGDKLIGLLYGVARLVDEAYLQISPAGPSSFDFLRR
jgi:hypothetical protein